MGKKKIFIGVDIGGTNTVVGLVDDTGKCLRQETFSTRSKDPFHLFVDQLNMKIEKLGDTTEHFLGGIGIGAPGANHNSGIIEAPENFNWGYVPLSDILHEKYHLPVLVMNDADAAAWGEMYFGIARNLKNFIYITLGTGLGSCVVVDGKICSGSQGLAGELGHAIIHGGKRRCACGKKGCLETYISADGIRRTVFDLMAMDNMESALMKYSFNDISPKIVTEVALKGDALALKTYKVTGEILGEKLANLVGLLNPEAIILAGGLVAAGDILWKPLEKRLNENLLNMHKGSVDVCISKPDVNYAVLGAASLLMNKNGNYNVPN